MSRQMFLPSEEFKKLPGNEKVQWYVRLRLSHAAKNKIVSQGQEKDRSISYIISSILEAYYDAQ